MKFRFEHAIRISLFVLGFSSLATKVFLIRECFSVLNGNELVIGIVLERKGFTILTNNLRGSNCKFCGEKIAGIWG